MTSPSDSSRPSADRAGTIGAALEAASSRLARAGIDPARAEAERLLCAVLGTDRGGLVVRRRDTLQQAGQERLARWLERRSAREPWQHIVGSAEFYGIPLHCDGRALIPRPETEGLVDAVLALPPRAGAHVADLGTGSGCIALALARERPDLRLYAIDRSTDALELARENARGCGVIERIALATASFGETPADWQATMDVVVSNPPYVSAVEWQGLDPEVREHEPRQALVAGPTGYECFPLVIASARHLLAGAGHLALEVGSSQAWHVSELLAAEGFDEIRIHRDLCGIERVVVARCAGRERAFGR